MAYFAELDDNNIVLRVVSVSNNDAPDPAPNDAAGHNFLNSIGITGRWIQTSFNGKIRKQPAGIGYTYDPTADVFVAPQPFPSWLLDNNHDWQAPIPKPSDDNRYRWDETTVNWVPVD